LERSSSKLIEDQAKSHQTYLERLQDLVFLNPGELHAFTPSWLWGAALQVFKSESSPSFVRYKCFPSNSIRSTRPSSQHNNFGLPFALHNNSNTILPDIYQDLLIQITHQTIVNKMASGNQLRVNLGKPILNLNAHGCLYVHQGTDQNALTVSFKRTIRVVSDPFTLEYLKELTFW